MIAEHMENADAPPPDGSTAMNTCCTFRRWSRSSQVSRSGVRISNAVMSSSRYSFSEPSALIPKLSLKL